MRTTWLGMLGGLVLFTTACDEDPESLGDAGGPVLLQEAGAMVPLFDGGAALPDASVPGADTGIVFPPPGDTGVVTPIPNDGGQTTPDGAVVPADAQVQHDAHVPADGAVPTGDAATPTSGFPPVADTSAKGPYTAKTVENTGPGGDYTLYHPAELAPGGALNPIVSWGNGGATFPALYPLLPHLASHGFVVIASNSIGVTGAQVREGVDWIVQQNETASSPFYKKLDTRNIAGVGYSLGGLATLENADDPRFVTIVIISGANTTAAARTQNMPKLRTPTAYLCTEDDSSRGNCEGDFNAATVPAFFGVMKGTGHVDVVFSDAVIGLLNVSTTAWLRWRQMGDLAHKAKFVGSGCGLCTDSKWTVKQKNLQ